MEEDAHERQSLGVCFFLDVALRAKTGQNALILAKIPVSGHSRFSMKLSQNMNLIKSHLIVCLLYQRKLLGATYLDCEG